MQDSWPLHGAGPARQSFTKWLSGLGNFGAESSYFRVTGEISLGNLVAEGSWERELDASEKGFGEGGEKDQG